MKLCFLVNFFLGLKLLPASALERLFSHTETLNKDELVEPTNGQVWPKPEYQQTKEEINFVLNPENFQFGLSDGVKDCEIIVRSLERFRRRIFTGIEGLEQSSFPKQNSKSHLPLNTVFLKLIPEEEMSCESLPHLEMNEAYEIKIEKRASIIEAEYSWGLLRGLETFSQIVTLTQNQFLVKETHIKDSAKFPHRGVMIDSSRHFLSMDVILQTLDLMEMNKMNVLHWRLTDDSSFPYESKIFPELSEKGAFDPKTQVYTQMDVEDVISEAALRGIRVIPEFDLPEKESEDHLIDPKDHTQSWGMAMPDLMVPCDEDTNRFGPMDPTNPEVYNMLQKFFNETKSVFPDDYVHAGGDKVDTHCWTKSRALLKRAKRQGMDGNIIPAFFFYRIQAILRSSPNRKKSIVRQDAFENSSPLKEGTTIVEIWKDQEISWKDMLSQVTNRTFYAIVSAPWNLQESRSASDWIERYEQDIEDFDGGKEYLLGGQVWLWSDFINSANLIPTAWPRASAVAERLWSDSKVISTAKAAAGRFMEHECRMMQRGYAIVPQMGTSHCNDKTNSVAIQTAYNQLESFHEFGKSMASNFGQQLPSVDSESNIYGYVMLIASPFILLFTAKVFCNRRINNRVK